MCAKITGFERMEDDTVETGGFELKESLSKSL